MSSFPRDLTGIRLGRFLVRDRLGGGGMGEVYRADDMDLKRTVAIKRLAPQVARTSASAESLLKEAQRASALNHPGIVAVYDVFREDDELFLVMEYIDGITLRQRMHEPLSVRDFMPVATQCLDALIAAHRQGVLHGDLKPANIMLTRHGVVKVCDFGLARRVPRTGTTPESMTTTTASSGAAGTPAYMAPEVALERAVDVRADLFSLGAVFYEMLAARNPFASTSAVATLDRVLHETPEPIERTNHAVTPRLSRFIHKLLEKEPSQRYASATDAERDLAVAGAELVGISSRRRGRMIVATVATAALIIAGGIALPKIRSSVANAGANALPMNLHLAVLPFTEGAADPGRQYFAQGLAEAITSRLARLTIGRQLQVASIADIRARGAATPADVRDQLGANVSLTGSLAYSTDLVTVTASLIDTRTGQSIRSGTITGSPDPQTVQDRVVELAVRLLNLKLTSDDTRALFAQDTTQPGAYDYYLQARGYLLNYDRMENLDSAVAVFRKALEIDQRYALAYAGLGQAYWRKHELTGSSSWVEPARGSCEGALAIDRNLAQPHACLAMVLNGTGAYEQAAVEYTRALQLEPTDDVLYSGLASAYEKLGRSADAEQAYRRAIALRPNYWSAYNTLAAYYYRTGRYDDAAQMFQQVVNLAPDSFRGYSSLGATYFMKDRTADAIAAFEKSLALRPNYAAASNLGTLLYFDGQYQRSAALFRQALALDKSSYLVWGNLAAALEQSGNGRDANDAYRETLRLVEERIAVNPRDAALQLMLANCRAALQDVDGARVALQAVLHLTPTDAHVLFQIAAFYEYRLHERDQALEWLARAVEHGQTWREVDRSPALQQLRQDGRFTRLRGAPVKADH